MYAIPCAKFALCHVTQFSFVWRKLSESWYECESFDVWLNNVVTTELIQMELQIVVFLYKIKTKQFFQSTSED